MHSPKHVLRLTLMALLAFGSTAYASVAAKDLLQDGVIVIVTPSELVLRDAAGKDHSYEIVEKTLLSLDGKACRAKDLKSGLKARVTTNTAKEKTALYIDAISKNLLFEFMLEGKIVTADNESLVMIAEDAKTHSFIVTKDTKVTCDGKECKASDLPADSRVRVTKDKTDEHVLLIIEAIDKNPDF